MEGDEGPIPNCSGLDWRWRPAMAMEAMAMETPVKRALVLFLVLGIVVGSLTTASAAKKKPKPRVVMADYGPDPTGSLIRVDVGTPGTSFAQVPFAPTATERKVSVSITDDSGQLVRGRVRQADSDMSGYFCGKTSAPVRIAAGGEILVEVYSGTCSSGTGVGAATQGTITATFTR